MYFLNSQYGLKLCLFKEGKNYKESKEYIDNGIIDNHVVLIVGTTGSGKSVFCNVMGHQCKEDSKPKRTLIYISDKIGEELANAYHLYNPTQSYHTNLLKEQHEDMKTFPAKLYHPLTFNIPFRSKIPPINWISYDVKKISEYGFDALIPSESEIASERALEISKNLNDDDSIYDFLWMLYQDILEENKEKDDFNPKDMFLPVEGSGDKRTVKNVRDAMKGFRIDYMVHPANSRFNLDYVKMCNDSENIHHLTTKFIKSRKRKVFAILEFLNGIDEALKSGKVKNQLVLVFEEMKILLPAFGLKAYEKELLSMLKDVFSRIRTKAFVIATAQSYFDINTDFTGTFDKVFLGKLNPNDLKVLIKDFQFRVADQEKLYGLKVGEFVLWESNIKYSEEKLSDKIIIDVPVFANHEEGESFFTKFKETYPDKVKNNLDVYKILKKMRDSAEEKRKRELKLWKQQKKVKEDAKKLSKEGKVEEANEKIKDLKQENKEILMQRVYELRKEHPDWSWRTIAGKVKGVKTHNTAKKYYYSWKSRLDNMKKLPDLDKVNPNKVI